VKNAYKYSRDATRITLVRKAGGWYLVETASAVIYQAGGKKILSLTSDQDVIAYEKVRTNYSLQSLSA